MTTGKGSRALERDRMVLRQAAAECSNPPHHWIVPTPNGETWVDSKCKKCGETQEMRNSMPQKSTYWKRTVDGLSGGKPHGLTKQQLDKKLGPRKLEPGRLNKNKEFKRGRTG